MRILKILTVLLLFFQCGISLAQNKPADKPTESATVIAIPSNYTKTQTISIITGLAAASDTSLTAVELDENGQIKKNAFVVHAQVDESPANEKQNVASSKAWILARNHSRFRIAHDHFPFESKSTIQNKNLGQVMLEDDFDFGGIPDYFASNDPSLKTIFTEMADGEGYTITLSPPENKTNLPVRPTVSYRYYVINSTEYDQISNLHIENYKKNSGLVWGMVVPAADHLDVYFDFSRSNFEEALTTKDNSSGIVQDPKYSSFNKNVFSFGFNLNMRLN